MSGRGCDVMVSLVIWLTRSSGVVVGDCAFVLFLSSGRHLSAQQAHDRPAVTDAHTESAPTLSSLPAFLTERYSTVRALVLVRGNCTRFEYYGKGISPATQSPMHSVTKSLLSILVGIAIDDGDLRLDEKLPELVPDAFDSSIDP